MRNWLIVWSTWILLGADPLFLIGCATTGGASHQPGMTLTSIQVLPASGSVTTGSTLQFKATGIYSDNSTQDLTSSVAWASSNTAIATISASGMATGVTSGQSAT